MGWFWFLGTLVPVVGLVQVGGQAMADRYTYIPLIGIFVIVVWGATELGSGGFSRAQRLEKGGLSGTRLYQVYACLAAAALALCIVVTRQQLGYWRSTTALLEHALAVTEDNSGARSLLAIGLEADGRMEEAIAQFISLAAVDSQYQPHVAYLLSRNERWQEAADHYQAAVKENPKDVTLRLGLAEALQKMGRDEGAVECLETALQIEPESVQALK
jgi:cytochrome c-type biogenesis protein CcmH/NrfG